MRSRILKSIGIVTVVAATAAPSALAVYAGGQDYAGPSTTAIGSRPDDGLGAVRPVQVAAVDTSDAVSRYLKNHQSVALSPDDRNVIRTSPPAAITPVRGTGSSFDWGDAGIGAGSALGLFLLMGVGTALALRNRKSTATA